MSFTRRSFLARRSAQVGETARTTHCTPRSSVNVREAIGYRSSAMGKRHPYRSKVQTGRPRGGAQAGHLRGAGAQASIPAAPPSTRDDDRSRMELVMDPAVQPLADQFNAVTNTY